MPGKKPPVHPRLDNERHEQFARCIAVGNQPHVCYIGVGYPRDPNAAEALAKNKAIRLRSEEIYRQRRPAMYAAHGYKHLV